MDPQHESPHWRALALLIAAYALAVLALRPFGNVLYGSDDFAYAWSVKEWLTHHRLVASSWVTAAAVPQVLWGALFSGLFGFSLRTLNAATLALSALTPPLVYLLAVELGQRRRVALLAGLFSTLNPLFLGFAASFMSDAYYLVLMLAASLAFLRALRLRCVGWAFGGAALASLGLLQRQIGIALPLAFVATAGLAFFTRRWPLKQAAGLAGAASSLPLLTLLAYRAFPDAFGGVTHTQLVKLNSAAVLARMRDVPLSCAHAYTIIVYVAVFCLPLVAALLPAFLRRARAAGRSKPRVFVALGVLGLALGGFGLARAKKRLFVGGEFLQSNAVGQFGGTLWFVLAALGVALFPLLVCFVASALKPAFVRGGTVSASATSVEQQPREDRVLLPVFLAASWLIHVALTATFISFYNNYFLPLVPLALLLVNAAVSEEEETSARRWLPGVLASVVLAFVWTVLNLDGLYRYVEADARVTKRLLAHGIATSEALVNYPGNYAWREYAAVDKEIHKDPWGLFSRIRRQGELVLSSAAQRPKDAETVSTSKYSTLLGTERLVLHRPPPPPKPSEAR